MQYIIFGNEYPYGCTSPEMRFASQSFLFFFLKLLQLFQMPQWPGVDISGTHSVWRHICGESAPALPPAARAVLSAGVSIEDVGSHR